MKRTTATLAMALAALAVAARTAEAGTQARDEAVAADVAFLEKYMPEKDRAIVDRDYLRRNAALAREAYESAPWRGTVPDEIYREYILPYSSIAEYPDDWRPLFCEKFPPLVKGCKTTGEAAKIVNSRILGMLDVRYDTRRDKPDQSPFHSMRIHMASCTGLAILQIDALRACGIPARFTGCCWTPIPGNHSWVEYYDEGTWHFCGDLEEGKLVEPDRSWFTPYAGQADPSSPRTRIYAARWSPTGTWFWGTWTGKNAPTTIPADDVTASYARFREGLPESRVSFAAYGPDGRRVPVRLRLANPWSGKILAEGETYGETHDANDHFTVSLPERTVARVLMSGRGGGWREAGFVEFDGKPKFFRIDERGAK